MSLGDFYETRIAAKQSLFKKSFVARAVQFRLVQLGEGKFLSRILALIIVI